MQIWHLHFVGEFEMLNRFGFKYAVAEPDSVSGGFVYILMYRLRFPVF